MDEADFRRLLTHAELIGGDYAAGYAKGLRRHYHGEEFGSPGEHLILAAPPGPDDDASRREIKRGYRDGCEGRSPADQ